MAPFFQSPPRPSPGAGGGVGLWSTACPHTEKNSGRVLINPFLEALQFVFPEKGGPAFRGLRTVNSHLVLSAFLAQVALELLGVFVTVPIHTKGFGRQEEGEEVGLKGFHSLIGRGWVRPSTRPRGFL